MNRLADVIQVVRLSPLRSLDASCRCPRSEIFCLPRNMTVDITIYRAQASHVFLSLSLVFAGQLCCHVCFLTRCSPLEICKPHHARFMSFLAFMASELRRRLRPVIKRLVIQLAKVLATSCKEDAWQTEDRVQLLGVGKPRKTILPGRLECSTLLIQYSDWIREGLGGCPVLIGDCHLYFIRGSAWTEFPPTILAIIECANVGKVKIFSKGQSFCSGLVSSFVLYCETLLVTVLNFNLATAFSNAGAGGGRIRLSVRNFTSFRVRRCWFFPPESGQSLLLKTHCLCPQNHKPEQ